ncbi:MAG TPA: FAD:protein FMN transferase [Telluria sp.]|nr:FAD:protein FMN transferase [Telluria sp.]
MNKAKRMRPLLGTFVEIGAQSAHAMPESAIAAAFAAVERVQALLSFHDAGSELSRLNLADGKAIALHPLSLRVLRLAQGMTRASGGLFNCTVGGELVRLGVLPDHGCGAQLGCGVAEDIELHGATARLRRPVLVTLDGIAKGYAVDCAIRALQRRGITAGWVNAGGDLRAFGDLVLPVARREADGSMVPLGGLREAAIATSGIRASHDATFPGWVVGASRTPGVWSVLAPTAWRADALTKVAGLAEESRRARLVRQLGGRLVERAVT